jgi:hypothetical protein
MKHYGMLFLSLVLLGTFCTISAQESDDLARGPDGGTEHFVNGIRVLPASGKPFSGRSSTEWTRTLEDGTVVTTHLSAMVARDSQGRIFREIRQLSLRIRRRSPS